MNKNLKIFIHLLVLILTISMNIGIGASQALASSVACSSGGSFDLTDGVISNGESCRGNLVIPEGATSIAEGAFSDASNIESVFVPASLTLIPTGTFSRYGQLNSYNVDEGNPNYSSSLGILYNKDKSILLDFPASSTLTTFSIPNSVTTLAEQSFSNVTELTQLTLGTQVSAMGSTTLYGMRNLTNFVVPAENSYFSSLDGVLFNKPKTTLIQFPLNSEITTYVVPNSVIVIKNDSFHDAERISSISIPNSVTIIEESAFYGASSLTSITIGNGVTSIGNFALAYLDTLPSVVFPNSVTSLGTGVMQGCESLVSVTLPSGLTFIPEQAFTYAYSLASITIPASVNSIGQSAFYQARSLTTVTFPAGLTSIGQWAFESARNLASVIFLGSSAPSVESRTFRSVASGATVSFSDGATGFCGASTWYGLIVAGQCPNCSAIPGGNLVATESGWNLSWNALEDITNVDDLDIFIKSSSSSDYQDWYDNSYGLGVQYGLVNTSNSVGISRTRVVEVLSEKVNEYSLTSFNFSVRKNNGTAHCYISTTLGTVSIPTFSLSSSSESKIVNTLANGFTVSAADGDFINYAISAVPVGMTFDTSTGALTGTPRIVSPETVYTISSTNNLGLTIRRTYSLTITRDYVEEARLAKLAEIAQAKTQIQTAVKDARGLTLEVLAKAEIKGATKNNLPLINNDLAKLSPDKRGELSEILKVIRKYEVVDILASPDPGKVQSTLLVEIGLIPSDSKNKTSLVNAIRNLNSADRSSYEAIQATIKLEIKSIQARKDRTAAIINKISTRGKTDSRTP